MNSKLFHLLGSLRDTTHCFSNHMLTCKLLYQKGPAVHLVQPPASDIRRHKNIPHHAPELLCQAVSQGENLSPSLSWQMNFASRSAVQFLQHSLFHLMPYILFKYRLKSLQIWNLFWLNFSQSMEGFHLPLGHSRTNKAIVCHCAQHFASISLPDLEGHFPSWS